MHLNRNLIALSLSAALLAIGAVGCDNGNANATSAKADEVAKPAETDKPAEAQKADTAAAGDEKAAAGDDGASPAQDKGKGEAKADAKANDGAAPRADYAHPGMLDPAQATEKAPDTYQVKFDTTAGSFTVEVHRDWAPKGADRFYNLVKIGYYDDVSFFRVIDGFMAQFGIHGDPRVNKVWREAKIDDDPVKESNKPGYISFAMAGPNTRTTQLFINLVDNNRLDSMGFSPFAKVVKGMDVVQKIHSGYGEGAPRGRGPSQGLMQTQGNTYLKQQFPKLDFIKKAEVVKQ